MKYGMVPPPADLNSPTSSNKRTFFDDKRSIDDQKEKQYIALTSGYTTSKNQSVIKKRTICEDDYFETASDEDDDNQKNRFQKKQCDNNESTLKKFCMQKSDSKKKMCDDDTDDFFEKQNNQKLYKKASNELQSNKDSIQEEEEDDPLDAFMIGIEEQALRDKKATERKEKIVELGKSDIGGQTGRGDIDDEDMQESYFKFFEEYQAKHKAEEDDEVYEYDEDGNIIWTWKKIIDPLPPIDHSKIMYKSFRKNFYNEHEHLLNLSALETFNVRMSMDIKVYGSNVPKPVTSFAYFSFPSRLQNQIQKSEFEKPTPIQAQAIPAALEGRDVLGLAKTGSGKTMAYIWPAIVHIINQETLVLGDGPIALIVVPTRELAIQVYQHAKTYCRLFDINAVCVYGGGSKYEQKLALEELAELVICTPGRIIDMIKIEATNFLRTTFLVFDEVDRMFDLGFEPQVKSIADHIRPDRQCLMFSATMRNKVEKLVVHVLHDPVKIVCGDIGEANADVKQIVCVLSNVQEKWNWLSLNFVQFCSLGKLLIFVTKKVDAEELAKKLKLMRNADLVLLHGDMLQHERNEQITAFRSNKSIMVATDVAARGLDIPEIKTVLNYDVARDIDTHVHRIGRTGRAGQSGTAYTLITDLDKEFAGHLVTNLESAGQLVPPELMTLALKSSSFKAARSEESTKRQRLGLGYKRKDCSGPNQSSTKFGYLTSEPLKDTSKPLISKIVERAKGITNSNSGEGLSRVEMMRSAMKSSFQYTFHKASSDEWSKCQTKPSDPRPEWRIELEKRAAQINNVIKTNATIDTESKESTSTSSVTFGQKKKRSRWQND